MGVHRFTGRYEVWDGYVTGARPQYFSIDESAIESDMDEEALRTLFDESMQEDFEKNAYPAQMNEDEFVAWAKRVIAAREE